MPIHEYVCSQGHKTEQMFLTFAQAEETRTVTCSVCLAQNRRRQARKIISVPGAPVFSGTGWTPTFHKTGESQISGVPVHKGDDPMDVAKKVVQASGNTLAKAVKAAK
jgi:predicted nucleic acid-binding Zn ribbon protein